MRARRVIAGIMIILLVVVAVIWSNYNAARGHVVEACWSPTTPGGTTAGLWYKNSDGSYTKVEDYDGWITQPIWAVYMPEQNTCDFPNGWHN